MLQLAGVLPRYPDGTYAFQRRDKFAPTSPLQLALFGGGVEKDDKDIEAAARREFNEETSLQDSGRQFTHLLTVKVPRGQGGHDEDLIAHLFGTDIPEGDFEVFEGTGTERYTIEELLAREDVAETARFILSKYIEEK